MRKSLSILAVILLTGTMACEITTGDDDADGGGVQGRGNGKVGPRGIDTDPALADGAVTDGAVTTEAGASNPGASSPGASNPGASNPGASNPGTSGDAGGAADSGPGTVVGAAGASDSGAPPPSVPNAETFRPLDQCPVFGSASAACEGADLFEPNDTQSAAIALSPAAGCSYVAAKLSSKSDVDWYSFTATRSDPVRVRIAYETSATGASDIQYEIRDPMDSLLLNSGGKRESLAAYWDPRFVAGAGLAYKVKVYDRGNNASCQGYNLQVETNFCTDAYEDNDSMSKAAPGITYGATISATAFSADDDWYDLTAVQTAGAKCTITTQLTLTSPERLDFQFRTGADSLILSDHLDGASGSTALTFTLKAASGIAALRIFSNQKVCSPYTVVCNPL